MVRNMKFKSRDQNVKWRGMRRSKGRGRKDDRDYSHKRCRIAVWCDE